MNQHATRIRNLPSLACEGECNGEMWQGLMEGPLGEAMQAFRDAIFSIIQQVLEILTQVLSGITIEA